MTTTNSWRALNMIPKETLQHIVVVAIIILWVGVVLYWKPRKRPAHLVEGERRCLQSFDVIKETIPMCVSEEQLEEMTFQIDEFYLTNYDFVQTDALKALVTTLDRAVMCRRAQIKKNAAH
jgi:hypothetical protein